MPEMLRTLIAELKALRPIVWVLAAAAFVMAVFLYMHQDWRLHERLYEKGMHAEGVVTAKDVVGGKTVEYSFRVGEKSYRGQSTAGYGNPSFAALSLDDQVIVFYLPEDPSVSTMGDPKLRVEDQHRWMAWALILFLPGVVSALASELKKHG